MVAINVTQLATGSIFRRVANLQQSAARCAPASNSRDHRPWYDRQRPPLFAEALKAAKRALDPHGLLNPGVLIDA
jgi:hypothetical protein